MDKYGSDDCLGPLMDELGPFSRFKSQTQRISSKQLITSNPSVLRQKPSHLFVYFGALFSRHCCHRLEICFEDILVNNCSQFLFLLANQLPVSQVPPLGLDLQVVTMGRPYTCGIVFSISPRTGCTCHGNPHGSWLRGRHLRAHRRSSPAEGDSDSLSLFHSATAVKGISSRHADQQARLLWPSYH